MRRFQTYILRLLIEADPALSDGELHGVLQGVVDQQPHPFKSSAALLSLLQQLNAGETNDATTQPEKEQDI